MNRQDCLGHTCSLSSLLYIELLISWLHELETSGRVIHTGVHEVDSLVQLNACGESTLNACGESATCSAFVHVIHIPMLAKCAGEDYSMLVVFFWLTLSEERVLSLSHWLKSGGWFYHIRQQSVIRSFWKDRSLYPGSEMVDWQGALVSLLLLHMLCHAYQVDFPFLWRKMWCVATSQWMENRVLGLPRLE